jgi:CheY-like chemotaxis protein
MLDLQRPDMDGFELIECKRLDPRRLRAAVMMLSSQGQRGHGARIRDA